MISLTSTPPRSRIMTNISPSVHPITDSRPRSAASPGASAALSSRVSEMSPPAQLHTLRVGVNVSVADSCQVASLGLTLEWRPRAAGGRGGCWYLIEAYRSTNIAPLLYSLDCRSDTCLFIRRAD